MSSSTRTAIIFGVTGQDGSYLAELLLSKAYEVVGVARRVSTSNTGRISRLLSNPAFSLVSGDITDLSSVLRILREAAPHEVYNLAAQSHVKVSFDEPLHTTMVDYVGCLNLLEAIRLLDLGRRTKFYQASSSEMFGSAYSLPRDYDCYTVVEHFDFNTTPVEFLWSSNWCDNDDEEYVKKRLKKEIARYGLGSDVFPLPFQNEDTPFLPCSPYAIAKVAAHHATRLYRESYGLFACSGILYNHESVRRAETFVTKKITNYVQQYAKGLAGPLRLGNLDAKRDWGFAGDYVRAMWLMLQQDKPDDFVIATGETHSVREFLHVAFATIGVSPEEAEGLVEIDPALFRPSEVPYLRGDASKAERVLGWRPSVSFQELARLMVLNA